MADYRRSVILINKPFQLRFCVYLCSWLLAICFVYPLIFSNLFEYFIKYLMSDPRGPEVASVINTRHDVMYLLVLSEVAFIGMTFLISLFMSHRIAGPIYKLRRTFQEFARGEFRGDLRFREKDYFPELAADFNDMAKSFVAREQKENEAIKNAIAHIEFALAKSSQDVRAELEPAVDSLRQIRKDRSSS